jgi:hypothetical protein
MIPIIVGGARRCQRLGVGIRHEHLAHHAHLGIGHVAIEATRS